MGFTFFNLFHLSFLYIGLLGHPKKKRKGKKNSPFYFILLFFSPKFLVCVCGSGSPMYEFYLKGFEKGKECGVTTKGETTTSENNFWSVFYLH
ncbi:hypothetical protein CDL12_24128 [Handroanthus impetiginosus]|uniref:Uncharacterized protein n=1 Tax=Handroanthus impetiginosus TaxID=429701 RepID=A0A2G9GDI4_9LAMI|nr:hypothetical protein CDL12_24128 [Handroanthus impetiginosus]